MKSRKYIRRSLSGVSLIGIMFLIMSLSMALKAQAKSGDVPLVPGGFSNIAKTAGLL